MFEPLEKLVLLLCHKESTYLPNTMCNVSLKAHAAKEGSESEFSSSSGNLTDRS
jgi:hypothetical protein